PTGGKIVRRDNGEPVKKVAFVQCAGSRDENHLPYCSSICCLASIKQANYVRDQYPESKVSIFYIDLRAPGKYEAFYKKMEGDKNVKFIKGKVARIEQDESGGATVTVEDILGGGKLKESFDLVVLATGMEPTMKTGAVENVVLNDDGFMELDMQTVDGFIPAGVAGAPVDVTTSIQNSTGAALLAFQCGVVRRG
ncbi:Anaerobic respiratory complex protein QmoA, partial [hydrothermal vent metagenome]